MNAKVEKKPASEWLVFSFDIAEGEHKDFYNKRYNENTNEDTGGSFLKTYIEERAVEIANYIVENGATVRQRY